MRTRFALSAALLMWAAPQGGALAQGACPDADKLGVVRTVEIDTTGAPGFGFEHYKAYDFLRLREVVAACAAQWTAIDVTLGGFGVFATPVPVLFLAPVVTEALLLRQRALADALADQPCDPHYRPRSWVPHVTLAKGGAAGDPGWMGRAIDTLAPLWPALRPACGEGLDLVHFRPVTVLQSHRLPSGLAHAAASV